MLDNSRLYVIFETVKTDQKTLCFRLCRNVGKMLKNVRGILMSGCDFSKCADGENIRLWLFENFPKLEQTARNDMAVLKHTGFLKGKGIPLFFTFFCEILEEIREYDEGELEEIFEICCCYDGGLDIKNTRSLVYLFRVAVCFCLCECFDVAHHGENDGDPLLTKIENLFKTLDNLYCFDEERVLKACPAEKILRSDPSGLYGRLTDETKASYRKNLTRLSHKKLITEEKFAEQLIHECRKSDKDDRHVGKYLCDKPRGGALYLAVIMSLTLIFTILLCMISPVFVACVLPVYGFSKLFADKFYTRFFARSFKVPETELEKIPCGNGVMTVVTVLLTDEKNAVETVAGLEEMYHSNGGENVYFGLLCDLPDSHEKSCREDEVVVEKTGEKILELRRKYGDKFFFFTRSREYCVNEDIYTCPERKRGAVMALTEFLCGKCDKFSPESIKPSENICKNVRYVLTLDSDTKLSFGSIKRMVGIMAHPCNKPILSHDKSVVKRGYGIIQPAINPTPEASAKSFFSSVMCGHGGIDSYSTGCVDSAMSLFGQSIFCGKGMFDKNAFYETLCGKNAFEKRKILSHDAPEGARLRCAYIPDIFMIDSFPSEELSYFKRKHRWIRGDIQNIPFLFGTVRCHDGRKIKNKISLASRFFMWQNIYSSLVPLSTVVTLLLSLAFGKHSVLLVTVAFSVYILPFVYSLLATAKRHIWQNIRRVFFSRGIYTGIWTDFMLMLFKICLVPKSAAVSLDAIVRSVYRMTVSKKHLLEWTTSAQNDAEKGDGLLGYVRKNLVSAVLGTAFFVISDNGFIRLVSLMWLFLPVFAYFSGIKRKKIIYYLGDVQRKKLMDYCTDMWKFFFENVTELTNFLPCDNISVYPDRKMARMTSPTNIGLYLVSCVCVRKTGLIDSKELNKRLLETLTSVSELETCGGMLYNWYDVFEREPMAPKYVSSVDIGNYEACLVTVMGAAEEYKDELANFDDITELCKKLSEQSNPYPLYDRKRNLFYIGVEDRDGSLLYDKNRYDMLMSEARILSFVSTAKGRVPEKHYRHLSRSLTRCGGYMGLSSWNGTAFEFFMPELFIPSTEGSLVYEAERFAFDRMRKNGVRTKHGYVFGISESCYNELDSAANYKYFAFGVPEIAVRVFEKQNVISPYSSFLCLCVSPDSVISNLETLKKLGAYGEYGFYESVDFERTEESDKVGVVRCFMSHHIGMSICACTNALCDGAVSKWFMKDKRMAAARGLCDEKIPYDAYVKKVPRTNYPVEVLADTPRLRQKLISCIYARLSFSKTEIFAKRDRVLIKNDDKILVSREKCFVSSLGSLCVKIFIDNEQVFMDRKCTLYGGKGKIQFSKDFSACATEKYKASLSMTLENNTSDIVRIRINLLRLLGRQQRKVRFSISFYPLLDTRENGLVCSFFDAGDVILNLSQDEKSVYFRRNSRGKCFYAGAVAGMKKSAAIRDGEVFLEAEAEKDKNIFFAEFAISISDSKKCAEMGLFRCREKSFDEAAENLELISQKEKPGKKDDRRRNAVLGYSMVKEIAEKPFPFDSNEKPFYLLSGMRFNTLVSEHSLGVSFVGDINSGRVTYFCGTKKNFATGEKIVFENSKGFDLCKNAERTEYHDDCVIYEGRYLEYNYRVTVSVSGKHPYKKAVVRTDYPCGVRFEAIPDRRCDGRRYIGSGGVLFEKTGSKEKGFVFGYANLDDGKKLGAEYKIEDGVELYFALMQTKPASVKEYVFFVGFSLESEAHSLFTELPLKEEMLSKQDRNFIDSIVCDVSKIPERIKCVLQEHFVFPKNGVCHRYFVKTDMHLHAFDTLLLVYTKSDLADKGIQELFAANHDDCVSGFMLCLAVCEYIRITGNGGFAEIEVKGENIYRRSLGYLLRDKIPYKYNSLYSLCLEEFSQLCLGFGDVKTSVLLEEKKQTLTDSGKDGIFL